MKKKEGVNPTKQHSMKCPKLYGKKCTCDGYHTFDELYEHRIALFIALCRQIQQFEDDEYPTDIWKSKAHHDGTVWDGWFIMGINTDQGKQISYHLPMKYWDSLNDILTLDSAPIWDGHTPDDVIERLLNL